MPDLDPHPLFLHHSSFNIGDFAACSDETPTIVNLFFIFYIFFLVGWDLVKVSFSGLSEQPLEKVTRTGPKTWAENPAGRWWRYRSYSDFHRDWYKQRVCLSLYRVGLLVPAQLLPVQFTLFGYRFGRNLARSICPFCRAAPPAANKTKPTQPYTLYHFTWRIYNELVSNLLIRRNRNTRVGWYTVGTCSTYSSLLLVGVGHFSEMEYILYILYGQGRLEDVSRKCLKAGWALFARYSPDEGTHTGTVHTVLVLYSDEVLETSHYLTYSTNLGLQLTLYLYILFGFGYSNWMYLTHCISWDRAKLFLSFRQSPLYSHDQHLPPSQAFLYFHFSVFFL